MARKLERLTAKGIESKRSAGYFADGGGLYLQVSSSGSKSWIFRYRRAGALSEHGKPKSFEMGLGPLHSLSLAEARRKAQECRGHLLDGKDPITERNASRIAQARAADIMIFSDCAEAYIKANKAGWKNAKHADQWTNTIKTYCGPKIGSLPVQSVDTGKILGVLEPIWTTKSETATRLRARIEKVLDWATVRGYRTGENPARWRGHLDKILPTMGKRKRVKHHPALPYDQLGEFMVDLRGQEGTAARALEFVILNAARTGEAIGAQWSEFKLDEALWTIPKDRMKAGREHRVPLSTQAVSLLRALPRMGDYVFPGQKEGKPLSNMAMLQLLSRMGRDDLTVHGFRSSFRDWSAERTNYPREVCEMALAHTIGDQVEAAYRRGDLFEKRRGLMTDWATYCGQKVEPAKVIPLGRKKA